MIKQEITHYPKSFTVKEYKEYYNGNLNVHTKYDERHNNVYLYLAYENLEYERRFDNNSFNSLGKIIYYKDNKGGYKLIDDDLVYEISLSVPNTYDITITPNRLGTDLVIARSVFMYGTHYCNYYHEKLPNGDVIKYNKNYFQEIYYEYHEHTYTGQRKIISFDELMELTQFKDFMDSQNICPVNESYFKGRVFKKYVDKDLFFPK